MTSGAAWKMRRSGACMARGEAQVVRRFPTLRHSLDLMSFNDRQLSFGGGKLYFPMSELDGDVWLMRPR